jgi:hypothetical protein
MEIHIPASDEGNEIYLRSLVYEVEKGRQTTNSPILPGIGGN